MKSFKRSKLLLLPFVFGTGVITGYFFQETSSTPLRFSPSQVRVYFTPEMEALPSIEAVIDSAQQSIYMHCYSFTSVPIAQALLRAHQRGVKVQIISDRSQKTAPHSQVLNLHRRGIPVYMDTVSGIAHNKILICDEEKVITGSYNFSKAAETRNAENLLILCHQDIAACYLKNWKLRQSLAIPLRKG
jgi:phosphatidylserine/phosphatidylglycerophosphate/cardiolipin synthase-like enzyme